MAIVQIDFDIQDNLVDHLVLFSLVNRRPIFFQDRFLKYLHDVSPPRQSSCNLCQSFLRQSNEQLFFERGGNIQIYCCVCKTKVVRSVSPRLLANASCILKRRRAENAKRLSEFLTNRTFFTNQFLSLS